MEDKGKNLSLLGKKLSPRELSTFASLALIMCVIVGGFIAAKAWMGFGWMASGLIGLVFWYGLDYLGRRPMFTGSYPYLREKKWDAIFIILGFSLTIVSLPILFVLSDMGFKESFFWGLLPGSILALGISFISLAYVIHYAPRERTKK